MHNLDYTGYRAILRNGKELLEQEVVGATSWPSVPTSQVAVLELWWRGVKKVSIDFTRMNKDYTPFYSRTAAVDASAGAIPELLSRNIGYIMPSGARIATSVLESTGEAQSFNIG